MILYFVKYNFTPVDFCSVKSVVKMQKQKRKKSKEKKKEDDINVYYRSD